MIALLLQNLVLLLAGFQEADKDSFDTASPAMDRGVWRVMVAITAVNGCVPHRFDIFTAFFQGRWITRDVFLRPLPEIGEPGLDMRLKKKRLWFGGCAVAMV